MGRIVSEFGSGAVMVATQPVGRRTRKLFITCADPDEALARRLGLPLGRAPRGVTLVEHLDENLAAEDRWRESLREIRECDVVIVLLSPALLASERSRIERAYARQLGKTLVGVRVRPAETSRLPFDLAEVPILDCDEARPESIGRLAEELERLPAAAPLPDPLPSEPGPVRSPRPSPPTSTWASSPGSDDPDAAPPRPPVAHGPMATAPPPRRARGETVRSSRGRSPGTRFREWTANTIRAPIASMARRRWRRLRGASGTDAEASTRRIHAAMFEEEGRRRREHTLRPGRRHLVSVWIGPGAVDRATVATPIPEADIRYGRSGRAELDVILVTEGAAGTGFASRALTLRREGRSEVVDLPLDVPPDVREVRASVVVLQDAYVLQSAKIHAPVADTDAPVGGRSWQFVRDVDVAPPRIGREERPPLDMSLSFHVGGDGDALMVQRSGDSRVLRVGDMEEFREGIVGELRAAVLHDDVDGAVPGSAQQVALMRRLARRGYGLYDQLASQLEDVTPGPHIQLLSSEDDVVPLELVYDYGMPTADAGLCDHWRSALSTGTCSCRPHRGEESVVCPLGFWGLRFVIERQLASGAHDDVESVAAGQLRPGNDTLSPFDHVLFAATSRVDGISPRERKKTFAHLTALLGSSVVEASTWRAWHDAIRRERPGLIMSLPHTDEVEGLVGLEIGKDFREVVALTDDYVLPAGASVGPVVFLLGCSTALTDVCWQSPVAAFRRRGATLVVGTIAETLGRQSAPMARLVADQLWGPGVRHATTMGEALRTVRRQLVLTGATLGMSLVAFGQSQWHPPQGR